MHWELRGAPLSGLLVFCIEGLDLTGRVLLDLLLVQEVKAAHVEGDPAAEVLHRGITVLTNRELLHLLPVRNVAPKAVVAPEVLWGTLTRAGDAVGS